MIIYAEVGNLPDLIVIVGAFKYLLQFLFLYGVYLFLVSATRAAADSNPIPV